MAVTNSRVMRADFSASLWSMAPSTAPHSARALASVAPLVKITWSGFAPASVGHPLARLFHDRARGAAMGMHRGRIAADRQAHARSPSRQAGRNGEVAL